MTAVSLGASAIIFDASHRVLLGHRCDMDAWDLPGGHVEAYEAPWQGAVRETLEETGLQVEVERLSGCYWMRDVGELLCAFVCTVVAGKPQLTAEFDQLHWFALDELPWNMSPKQQAQIHDAAVVSPRATLRIQEGPLLRGLIMNGLLVPPEASTSCSPSPGAKPSPRSRGPEAEDPR